MKRLFFRAWLKISGHWRNDQGQGMVEYGLIIALIAAVVIGILVTLGDDIRQWFQYIVDQIGTPPTTS